MSLIYLLALAGFALVMIAVMADAVLSVSRQPKWSEARAVHSGVISEVITVDQRAQTLPFVGAERRVAQAQAQATEKLKKVA